MADSKAHVLHIRLRTTLRAGNRRGGARAGRAGHTQDKVLKIGVLGVMSGPAASWGPRQQVLGRGHRPDVQ